MRICLASASLRRAELLRRLGVDFFSQAADINEDPRAQEAPQDYVLRLALEKAQKAQAILNVQAPILSADTTVVLDGEIFGKPENAEHAAHMLSRLSGRAHEVWTGVAWLVPQAFLPTQTPFCPPENASPLQQAAAPKTPLAAVEHLDFAKVPQWQTPQHSAYWQIFDLPAFFAPAATQHYPPQHCPPEKTKSALSGGQNRSIITGKLLRVRAKVQFYPLSRAQIDAYIASGEPFDKAGAYAIQGLGECFVQAIDGSFSNIMGLPLAEVAAIFAAYHLPFALQTKGAYD